MPSYSQEQVPIELELDVAQTRTVDEGGMTIAFERIKAGVETAPIYKGLPDDACQSPHWGYVIEGRLRIVLSDGTEDTAVAGQAYYLAPGHVGVSNERRTDERYRGGAGAVGCDVRVGGIAVE